MSILRIEHPVADYETWKRAFDSDPAGREKSRVRRYQILRPIDNPNYVMIDLEFDTPGDAEALLAAMRVVWARVQARPCRTRRRASWRQWRRGGTDGPGRGGP